MYFIDFIYKKTELNSLRPEAMPLRERYHKYSFFTIQFLICLFYQARTVESFSICGDFNNRWSFLTLNFVDIGLTTVFDYIVLYHLGAALLRHA